MLRKISALVLAVLLVCCISTAAFADYTELITTSWSDTVTFSSNPNGRYVTLYMYNTSPAQINQVRMIGWNGQVVWPGEGNDIPSGGSRQFWCGSDVAKVQVRLVTSTYPAFCYCNIHFN